MYTYLLYLPSKYKYLEVPNKVACRLIFFFSQGTFPLFLEHTCRFACT